MPTDEELTPYLERLAAGDPAAADVVFRRVEPELRAIAAGLLRGERPQPMLQVTLLVDEIFVRLMGPGEHAWDDRKHFYRAAARRMRFFLIDEARKRRLHPQELPSGDLLMGTSGAELADLDEALAQLQSFDPRAAQAVELHYLAGFTLAETAQVLEISLSTAKNDLAAARAWLHQQLTSE